VTAEHVLFAALALMGIVLSALYSGLETGLYTLNRVRLAVRAEHGERSAQRLRAFAASPGRMLATLLVSNNIANYAGTFGVAAILDMQGVSPVWAIIINTAILLPLLFVFGETLPKDLFRTHTDRWSYAFAGFLTWSRGVLTWTGLVPIVHGFGAIVSRLVGGDALEAVSARQRMSQLIREGIGAGVISETQTTLADRALSMRDLRVSSEMVPWPRVAALSVSATRLEREEFVRRHSYRRAPVVDGDGRMLGTVALLELLLEPDKPLRELMQPAIAIHPGTPVRAALQRMREAGCPMAVLVRPASGGAGRRAELPIGIVTLKDLVEPLIGEGAARRQ
jgi:putative hemolysin